MKTRDHKRFVFLAFALLIGLPCVVCYLWVRREQRQYALNRQLIAALVKKRDIRRALVLVEAGADPNTSVEPAPPPSLLSLIQQLLPTSPPKADTHLTAFVIAFGCEFFYPKGSNTAVVYFFYHPDPNLTQAMLRHGAKVNIKDSQGTTALHQSVISALADWSTEYKKNKEIITLLLAYGANPDEEDKAFKGIYGRTPMQSALAATSEGEPLHPDLLRKYSKHL